MRKSKRIIALVLALTMMFTFMAMSASAATTEIQPRASICPQCGGYGFQHTRTYWDTAHYYEYDIIDYYSSSAAPARHAHYNVPKIIESRCATCAYVEEYESEYAPYCPYIGFV